MSARNREPPLLRLREHPFGPSLGPPAPPTPQPYPHPSLFDEPRDPQFRSRPGLGPSPLLQHPAAAIFDDHLSAQYREIQSLLVDNQRLAATHVALRQELELAQHEIRRTANVLGSARAETEFQMREWHEKLMKMETHFRAMEAMKADLMKVRADMQQLTVARGELTGQVQGLTRDLDIAGAELQQVPTLKGEIEGLRQELQRARSAIEYEKKGYAENYEHGQAMEKNLVAMAREMEKLRAELSNAEKRARAASAVGNPAYIGSYVNPEMAYGVNPYPASYGMDPSGAEGAPQYGPGPGYGPNPWGSYDMQWAQGRR